MVRDLEREVGAPLFVRGHHQVTLTAAGRRLAERAAPVLAGFDALLPEVRSVLDEARSVLRIGSTHLTAPELVDAVAECAERAHPDREVMVELCSNEELAAMLAVGTLDLAVDYLPVGRSGLASRPLLSYRMGVAMRADDPLAGRPALVLADLADRTVQLLCTDPVPVSVTRVRRQMEERGVRDVRFYPVPDVVRLAEHVRRTGDISLAFVNVRTGATRAFHDPAFAVVPVTDGPDLELGVAWRADRADDCVLASVLAEVSARWPDAVRVG
jgi:DNA-binding transcriptional LysR family regulator